MIKRTLPTSQYSLHTTHYTLTTTLYIISGSSGVPLENFTSIRTRALFKFHWSSTGESEFHCSSQGCSWTWPSCARARGVSRSPNSWMRQCLEGELDWELWLVADPSQCKSTTWSDKVVVTFEQKLQLRFLFPQVHFDSILVRFWPRSSPNCLYKSTFS